MKRFLVALAIAVCGTSTVWAAEETSPLGRKIESFTLQDHRGAKHSLGAAGKQRATVIVMLGAECPLVKLYGPRLAELAGQHASQKVAFIGIDSNRQDSLTDIATYVRDSGIKFPVLKDPGNVVADQLGAVRTPEVFLLDENNVVRYWGRIDDRYGVGFAREKPTQQYLEQAINQLLAGKPIEKDRVDSVGCFIGRTRDVKNDSEITYSNQIARILQDRCVECHRPGEIGPFSLTEYSEVAGWADTIAEVVRERRMPPWHADPKHGHFRNDRSMPDAEKEQIYKWVAAGAPEGNPTDLPKPREYVQGWSLPKEPDLILDIQTEPYRVPADGVVDYQYFVADPGFTEDKWVKVSQILPGAPAVVHHVLCFVQPPNGERKRLDENGLGFMAAYVPGYRPAIYGEGMAKHVPAGSKLIFQMHYTPIGKEVMDQSKIGLVFAKPEELTHMVQTVSTGSQGLDIPPHAADYQREATMTGYKHDLQVLSFSPHMHVRGKAFSYEAIYPDGKREMLLDVPRYDFNWQTTYELTEPKVLPPGTRVHVVAHWDNSADNPSNPNPASRVHWGDQTFEEMMIGFFDVAIPLDREKLVAKGEIPQLQPSATIEDRARDLISQFDADKDGMLIKTEVPEQFQKFFGMIDQSGDGKVDVAEATNFVKLTGGSPGGFGGGRQGQGRGPGRGPGGRQGQNGNRGERPSRPAPTAPTGD